MQISWECNVRECPTFCPEEINPDTISFLNCLPNFRDWFITGKGKPYKKADSYPAAPAEIEASDLFNTAKMSDEENENENGYPANDENLDHIIDNKDITSQIRLSQRDENEKIGNTIPSMGKIRKIKRITIFYDDGSFEEFYK